MDERLIQYIERIERLIEEKQGIADDIKDVYAEANNAGYDKKAIREIIKLRKMQANEREESEYLREKYKELAGV